MRKLRDPEDALERFFDRIEALGDKLGPVLFQLPPRWRVNPDRLARFLERLPAHRYAFEFRDRSWHDERVRDLLAAKGAAFCIYDLAGERSPVEVSAAFVYLRLHGPGDAYQGSYDGRTLFGWARRIVRWSRDGKDVYCYFDNDQNGCAPRNASELKAMVDRHRRTGSR